MPQDIILAHLQSMQKQLDFLVHKHLTPLEIRQHHIAQALEQLEITTPSTNQDHTDFLDDEHTNRYEDSYQIQMLTESIMDTPHDPRLWLRRGLVWNRMGNSGIAISDFVRAMQRWLKQPGRLNIQPSERTEMQRMFQDIETLSPTTASMLTKRYPNLTTFLYDTD